MGSREVAVRACPVCSSDEAEPFLSRPGVPVHQNLVIRDQAAAVGIGRGNLDYVICRDCGFVFNRAFDLEKLSYGDAYDNTQSFSPVFAAYMDELAVGLLQAAPARPVHIVEVGCGKGGFLRKLVAADERNTGIGFDPTYVGSDSELGGRLRFERRFYDRSCAGEPPDLVVCRHVIEHVPDPVVLLSSIRDALGDAPQARVVFETPCVEWILQNRVVWDFFYEHCSLFSKRSLATAFQAAGFTVELVRHVFGGQYLWLEAVPATRPQRSSNPGPTLSLARRYAAAEAEILAGLTARLAALALEGRVAIWGAGAKGVTFANLVDPDRSLVTCVVDLNPGKQGSYLPGTGHPIIDYRQLPDFGVTFALQMNPNYHRENEALLEEAGLIITLAH
jgi:SAM-dependent methyltransferase